MPSPHPSLHRLHTVASSMKAMKPSAISKARRRYVTLSTVYVALLSLLVHCFPTACTHANAGAVPLGAHVPASNITVEFLDPTLPPVLPKHKPKCSVAVLQHDFFGASGPTAASGSYTLPADCPAPWTRIVLELSMVAVDAKKDRVAAVWVDGVEVLRTSAPLSAAPRANWKVHKDITRYSALLRRLEDRGKITMALEAFDADLPDAYTANISLHFYRGSLFEELAAQSVASPSVSGLYRRPADLIIPVSNADRAISGNGFWFQINSTSDVSTARISVPRNTYRAVLEIFASYHADEEVWYMHQFGSSNDGEAPSDCQVTGRFRSVYATIDGRFVGGHIPFAVIYPGSINPYLWSPVTAIGAMDMPAYNLEITPFLGLLLDGKPHEVGLGVKQGKRYWLLAANLHLWLDRWSDEVKVTLLSYQAPPLTVSRTSDWHKGDGIMETKTEGLLRFVGWVRSSRGNVTVTVRQKVLLKSQVEVRNRGTARMVERINRERMVVSLREGATVLERVQLLMDAPLHVKKTRVRAMGGAEYETTRMYHQLDEVMSLTENMVQSTSMMTDRQVAEGTSLVHDGESLWGGGSTKSSYKYRDQNSCYFRLVHTADGVIQNDASRSSCDDMAAAN